MSSLRNYSVGTRAALIALSGGTCYYPKCLVRVIKPIENDYSFNLHIAHIQGAQEKGARHSKNMTPNQRKAFANLILLCKGHHEYVDVTHPLEFSPATLLQWKSDREVEGRHTLAALTDLTEDNLRVILIKAAEAKHNEIIETLARLEVNDAEAAAGHARTS